MPIRKSQRRGKPCLVIDIRYTSNGGRSLRFRKDAQSQTMAAARTEEKRYQLNIAQYGSPYEPSNTPQNTEETSATNDVINGVIDAAPKKTFAEVVDEFRQTFMVSELKITSRRGYESVLRSTLVPRFGEFVVDQVDGKAAGDLDLELTKRKLSRATRNNTQVVLRSLLRFAKSRGYIGTTPPNLPKLKPVGQSVLEIPSDEQVDQIIQNAKSTHRLTFTLMADAGLRPNEVRALRCKDIQLRQENGECVGGFIVIREGRSHGEIHTPKTGQREIPLSRALLKLLIPVVRNAPREKHVALNDDGKPWGQYGIDQAFTRVAKRARVDGWSVYCLRHYAITSWLRAGIPVHVVQRMAGHRHLSTTQRYVHFLKADLEEAARRLPVRVRDGAHDARDGDIA